MAQGLVVSCRRPTIAAPIVDGDQPYGPGRLYLQRPNFNFQTLAGESSLMGRCVWLVGVACLMGRCVWQGSLVPPRVRAMLINLEYRQSCTGFLITHVHVVLCLCCLLWPIYPHNDWWASVVWAWWAFLPFLRFAVEHKTFCPFRTQQKKKEFYPAQMALWTKNHLFFEGMAQAFLLYHK